MDQESPREAAPLNGETAERQVQRLETENSTEDKSTLTDMKKKLTKPTIGVSLIVFLILNIVMFFVGVTTTKECPIQPKIPIYLAVAGALGAVTKIIPILNRNKRIALIDYIVSGLLFVECVWMILGSIWIYSIYKPNYTPGIELYCDKTAYLLAFWLLTLHYIFLILMITIPCFVICILCCALSIASRN